MQNEQRLFLGVGDHHVSSVYFKSALRETQESVPPEEAGGTSHTLSELGNSRYFKFSLEMNAYSYVGARLMVGSSPPNTQFLKVCHTNVQISSLYKYYYARPLTVLTCEPDLDGCLFLYSQRAMKDLHILNGVCMGGSKRIFQDV